MKKSHSNEESTKKQAIHQKTFTCEHPLPHDTFIKAAIENSDDLERPEFYANSYPHTRKARRPSTREESEDFELLN